MVRKTTTIEVGIKPELTPQWFAEDFAEIRRNEVGNSADAPVVTESGTFEVTHVSNDTPAIRTTTRLTHEQFIAGLIQWAEQALALIEDTPDHWLRNALAILAGRWTAITTSADDWYEQVVCGYIAVNHGTRIAPQDTTA